MRSGGELLADQLALRGCELGLLRPNHTVRMHRFHRYRGLGTQPSPQRGAVGYGIPTALAAQLLHPKRIVVALARRRVLFRCAVRSWRRSSKRTIRS